MSGPEICIWQEICMFCSVKERSPFPTRDATHQKKRDNLLFLWQLVLIFLLLAALKSPTQSCFLCKRFSSVQQKHNNIEGKRNSQRQKKSPNSYQTSLKKNNTLPQTINTILILTIIPSRAGIKNSETTRGSHRAALFIKPVSNNRINWAYLKSLSTNTLFFSPLHS